MTLTEFCEQLESKIAKSYEDGVTQDEAERLGGEFLVGQLKLSKELKNKDLDARMKKSGLKAVKAACYLATAQGSEKKPTEAHIAAMIDKDELVNKAQDDLDTAEVEKDHLLRTFDIHGNAHVHFRTISKGRFE